MEEVDICINRSSNIPLSIMDQVLMVMVEVDIGLRQSTFTPITHVGVVYSSGISLYSRPVDKKYHGDEKVYICIQIDTLPSITQLGVVYFLCQSVGSPPVEKLFMVMRGVI